MASKQLGKLRQWAGEVISSWDKTTVSEEFQELEKDIELRRDGTAKLLAASEVYQRVLSKKKKNDTFEDPEKLLPLDTLGIVMVVHGEEFSDDSAFGTSLVKLGHAHCKVATLQEAYSRDLKDNFLSSLRKFLDDVKEYETQRKKLDSRRLSYDAAVSKLEKLKSSKKEKERHEAEEEMDKARERYEETSEDVQAQMHAIQENEIHQLRQLTGFLNSELQFAEQYSNILREVKEAWYDESSLMQVPPRKPTAPPHIFPRRNLAQRKDSSGSDEESIGHGRRLSKRSDSVSSRPPSRSSLRATRKRADSGATVGEKDEKEKASKRMGVAGWASSAVESVTGSLSKKSKDKDKFSSLQDNDASSDRETDEDGMRSSPKKSSTFRALTRKLSKSKDVSPNLQSKILKPPSFQERKVVRAVHSFSGSSDELSFKIGDEITVLNEVLDDWWMGELHGKKGLFPTTYVEPVAPKPTVPQRPGGSQRVAALSTIFSPVTDTYPRRSDNDTDSFSSSDFEDHDLGKQPLSASHASPFFSGPPDAASIISSLGEEEDDKLIVPFSRSSDYDSGFDDGGGSFSAPTATRVRVLPSLSSAAPSIPRRTTTPDLGSTTSGKKVPPPPPPRRSTTNALGPSPPIPQRPYQPKPRGPTPTSSVSSHSDDRSPFESVTELSVSDAASARLW